jgi:hypothetical protein
MSAPSLRRLLAAAVLVLLAVSALACSRNDPILTVNGSTLGRDSFMVELDQIAKNTGYQEARRRNGQSFSVFKEGSTSEYTPEFVAEFLNERVTFQLAQAELKKRNLLVTAEDRQRAVDVIVSGLSTDGHVLPSSGSGSDMPTVSVPGTVLPGAPGVGATSSGSVPPGTTPGVSGRAVLDQFGSYKDTLIDGVASLQVLQKALSKDITGDDRLRELYEQVKDEYANQACVRHILVRAGTGAVDPRTGEPVAGTDAEYANALAAITPILGRLNAGEDFATVATEVSQDPATKAEGGYLGCAPKGQYAGEFDAAAWAQPVGRVGGPVKTPYGYHLVLVTDRRVLSFDEVKGKLRDAVDTQSQQTLQEWLTTASQDATVVVDPQFGTWNKAAGLIAPKGSSTNLTLVPDQDTAPTSPGTVPPAVPRGTSAPR